jgi:surface polysaccharide O-acyltransferase-like enzyme
VIDKKSEALPASPADERRAATAGPATEPPARIRLFFADNLRVALTVLVVLHHLAVIYGASAPFYYVEVPNTHGPAFLVLLVFVLVNQGYFMGFFFLISGYFTPGSFDRKGAAQFLKDRWLRLFVPLVAFAVVLGPLAGIGLYQMPAKLTGITHPFTWTDYPGLIGAGPLWFVEVLLILAMAYAAWRLLVRRHQPAEVTETAPRYLAIAGFVLALALASYVVRIVIPLGFSVPILGLPTPGYLPQYVSFFVLGAIAFRRNWFRTIPGSMGKVGLVMAIVATVVLFPLALSPGGEFLGRGHWQSVVYALWDSTFSVGICLALITFFRRFFNRQGRLGAFLSRHAFTVYVIHAPVIVFLALALRGIHPDPLLKFALAAVVGVPLCFALAYLVRRLPLASRVL